MNFHTCEVKSPDGTVVGCEIDGAGPPLLFVHGSTADRNRWAAVRGALARRFTLCLMDRRGRGLSASEPAASAYALEREAEDVAAVAAAIGPGVAVLAHSYGGACVLEAAATGAALGRMLVYEPAFGTDPGGPVFPVAALAVVEEALARGDREEALRTFFADVLLLTPEHIDTMRETEAWRARVAVVHTLPREARAANAYRVRAGAGRGGDSVRFLLGTETAPPLVASTRAAAAAWPWSAVRELQGHGHAAMDADPELFVREVVDWLD